jgi:glutamate N-acetyltransferase/amino-acid N-acetyltransferase
MLDAIPLAVANMAADKWEEAARAIMTTDTRPKAASRTIQFAAGDVVLTGICKGSGMIHPNMATMLAFIGTDANISRTLLQTLLARAVDQTFNCITVDGDTSTNDACVLLASGHSAVEIKEEQSYECRLFFDALLSLCSELAEAIVRDGEGATKLIRVEVQGAANRDEARKVGFTVAHSPLVKTAFFASDPNWGRILAAVGRSGSLALEIERVNIWLDEVQIVENGGRSDRYEESSGAAVMAKPEITIRIELGRGDGEAVIKTCDFSYDYVRINAEYRT